LIIDYVERYKDVFGVEPIAAVLSSADVPIAASTFYAARTRPPSARAVRDEDLKPVIARVHQENYGVYGIRKMHAQLNREQVLAGCRSVARCTTQRLMRDLGLRGVSRAKGPRTTVPGTAPDTRKDLVGRAFTADRPDRLWVADITYVRTFAGWVYCAFVLDVFSRRIVGWQVSTSLRTDLALDACDGARHTARLSPARLHRDLCRTTASCLATYGPNLAGVVVSVLGRDRDSRRRCSSRHGGRRGLASGFCRGNRSG